MNNSLIQCDCCDYFAIPPNCDFEVCPVCFWEQDAFGILEPVSGSGANHGLTLREGRKNFRQIGACAARFKANVCSEEEKNAFQFSSRNV